ncbi:MAG: hypothetical protein P4M12_11670, partial [Gammaproteobacteria bacterium]|nr:hypothetical protein [Gammaproteobacteria bacterium]
FMDSMHTALQPYIVIPAEQIHKKHGSFWKLLTEVIVSSLALAAAPWAAPFLFTFAAGSLGAAVATGVTAGLLDAAMQGAACGVGLQDKFSISGVIETGVLGGFLAAAKGAAVANEARQAAATRTMLAMGKASVTSQLMEMSMGLRQKFDVKEVLTSMANGFANAKIEVPNTGQFAGRIVGNAVTTLTGTAITSLVYRQDPNLQYMAAQLLGSTIGTEAGQMLSETTERKAEPKTKLPKTQNRQAHVEELAHAELPDGNVDYGRHADAHHLSGHEENVKFKSDFFTNKSNTDRFRKTVFDDIGLEQSHVSTTSKIAKVLTGGARYNAEMQADQVVAFAKDAYQLKHGTISQRVLAAGDFALRAGAVPSIGKGVQVTNAGFKFIKSGLFGAKNIAHEVSQWMSPEEAMKTMSPAQVKNLKRFLDKIPANSENIRVKDFLNGGKVFQADSPARNIPGSFAQYEKQIDNVGESVLHTKTTFDPKGNIVDVARKFPPGSKVYPNNELDINLNFRL